MNKNKVYTIIVTYNGMQWIKECLDSVIHNTTVVVIDNNSSDETVSFIQENYKEVIILPQTQNLGFGAANNVGIRYAIKNGGQYTLLLNQDAKMGAEAVGKLISFSENNKQYGIVSPIHCDWSGNYLESSFARYVTYENNENFYSDFVLSKPLKEVYDVPFIAAACWFIPIEVYKKVGGFDPIFFHNGEDNNLAQRVQYHGFKIGILPTIKVNHDTKRRNFSKVEKYSEVYFKKMNYRLKAKYANVNMANPIAKINYQKKQVYKSIIMNVLQFKRTGIVGGFKELKLYDNVAESISKSIVINQKEGAHYL